MNMKPVVISGKVLCSSIISGIPRYAYEILWRIDELLVENDIKIDIRICYPKNLKVNLPKLNIIQKVQLDDIHGWQTHVMKNYVNSVNGIFCGFANDICLNKNGIVTIHDIRPLVTKKYDTLRRWLDTFTVASFAKINSQKIITVSEYQKKQICSKLHVNSKCVVVIPNGWEHMNSITSDYKIFNKFHKIRKKEYFYTLGSFAKHKNYKWIYEVAKRNPNKTFVIAGNEDLSLWGIDSKEFTAQNVIFVGYVSDSENKALMSECRAFLHPSYYEGFGIPPLEALSCGVPIIISNATCLPEIYGNCAHYIDPDNYNVDLDSILKEPVDISSIVLKKYTWNNAAKKWLNLLLSVK